MLNSYRRKLEFFLVVIIAAVIIAVAAERYTDLAKEAKILRLRVISEHFMTGAVNLRIEYLLSKASDKGTSDEAVMVHGETLFVSDQGWPVSTSVRVLNNFRPSDADCYYLWKTFLQNPPPITLGEFSIPQHDYRAYAHDKTCRYAMVDDDFYFAYEPLSGRLLFSSFIRK